ncbi:MAG: hypothetical protein V7782_14560, partial [Psychromonas sp.]
VGVLKFIKSILISFGKISVCTLMSILFFFDETKKYKWFFRGILHIGTFAKLCGKKEIILY